MAEPNARNPWIVYRKPRPSARLRLICLPFAGGSAAAYRSWVDPMPEQIQVLPVELPGRASRFKEPARRQLTSLVGELTDGLAPELDRPFAFFGHSMGALIAFEVTRELRRRGQRLPVRLFLSARRAPQVPPDEEPYYDLPEPEFIAKLRELNGTPEEVLAHPELMQMMIPLLRADFELNETYEYLEEEPFACPISAFGGLADEEVSREHLDAWSEHTRSDFRVRMVDGDHFFLDSARDILFESMMRDLSALL